MHFYHIYRLFQLILVNKYKSDRHETYFSSLPSNTQTQNWCLLMSCLSHFPTQKYKKKFFFIYNLSRGSPVCLMSLTGNRRDFFGQKFVKYKNVSFLCIKLIRTSVSLIYFTCMTYHEFVATIIMIISIIYCQK